MSEQTTAPVPGELSLEEGPLRDAIASIHRARRAVDEARDRVAAERAAFADVLRAEITTRHEAGVPHLAEQLAGIVRTAYWDHRELRVADIAAGTGLSQQEVRSVAGPLLVETACPTCDAPMQVAQRSRTEHVGARRCDACDDVERLHRLPSPFLFDGHQLDLHRHLDQRVVEEGCDHSLSLTRRWAMREGIDPDLLVAWSQARGGFCDCELLFNVADRIQW